MHPLYRLLLSLYPFAHRQDYGDEMLGVFREAQADACRRGWAAQSVFYFREITGLLGGALREHFRFLADSTPLTARRFSMRSEFRFPKSTTVLMCIILAGVILAIEKAASIATSLPYSNPQLAPIYSLPPTFPKAIGLLFAAVYLGAIVGWMVLFALRRSGVHRLSALDPELRHE